MCIKLRKPGHTHTHTHTHTSCSGCRSQIKSLVSLLLLIYSIFVWFRKILTFDRWLSLYFNFNWNSTIYTLCDSRNTELLFSTPEGTSHWWKKTLVLLSRVCFVIFATFSLVCKRARERNTIKNWSSSFFINSNILLITHESWKVCKLAFLSSIINKLLTWRPVAPGENEIPTLLD